MTASDLCSRNGDSSTEQLQIGLTADRTSAIDGDGSGECPLFVVTHHNCNDDEDDDGSNRDIPDLTPMKESDRSKYSNESSNTSAISEWDDSSDATITKETTGGSGPLSLSSPPPRSTLHPPSSISQCTSTTTQEERKIVRFGSIEVQEYGMIMGDHPDTEEGPALTISWIPQRVAKDTVDHFEETRPPRRGTEDLKVAPVQRKLYLVRIVGIPPEEVEASIRTAEETRRKRMDTVRKMKNEKFDIFIQSLQRKTARLWGKTVHPVKMASSSIMAPLKNAPDASVEVKKACGSPSDRNHQYHHPQNQKQPTHTRRRSSSGMSMNIFRKPSTSTVGESLHCRPKSYHGFPSPSLGNSDDILPPALGRHTSNTF